jgi:outer membrane lipoprotein-sorting protein
MSMFSLIAAALLALAPAQPAADAAAAAEAAAAADAPSTLAQAEIPPSAEAFFDEMARRRQNISALRARFIMYNQTPDFEDEGVGRLLYVRPRRIIFRIVDPNEPDVVQEAYLIEQDRLYEYLRELEQLQIARLAGSGDMEALFAAFEDDPEQLRAHYDVAVFPPGDEARRAAFGVLLTPKPADDGTAPIFERIRLYLRDEDYLPTKVQIVNGPESTTTLVFDDFEVNPELERGETQIALPKGATVVDEEEHVRMVEKRIEYIPGPKVAQPSPAANPSARAGGARP